MSHMVLVISHWRTDQSHDDNSFGNRSLSLINSSSHGHSAGYRPSSWIHDELYDRSTDDAGHVVTMSPKIRHLDILNNYSMVANQSHALLA